MNKKETEYVRSLETMLAFKLYPEVKPDVVIPEDYEKICNGYSYNTHSQSVVKACSNKHYHGYGQWDKTSRRGPLELYSTVELAQQALLHDMSMGFAKQLYTVANTAYFVK